MESMSVTIRRIEPGDGPLLKEIRLAALLDAPFAFARNHDEERVQPDERWEELAIERSAGVDHATFFALDGPSTGAIGLVGAHRLDPATVELVSMWTVPAARSRGVGAALVAAVVDFAAGHEVQLWVTRGNHPAQRLYERCGFELTGESQALPSDPCKDEIRMWRRP